MNKRQRKKAVKNSPLAKTMDNHWVTLVPGEQDEGMRFLLSSPPAFPMSNKSRCLTRDRK